MELLIRSQDRENLIRFENLFYFNNCNEMPSVGENYILNKMWIGDKDCVVLGKYKTKERALEVLDEIQKIISWLQKDMKGVTIGDLERLIGSFDDYVYEMPKE